MGVHSCPAVSLWTKRKGREGHVWKLLQLDCRFFPLYKAACCDAAPSIYNVKKQKNSQTKQILFDGIPWDRSHSMHLTKAA